MFITIEHDIHDISKFAERAERAMPPPAGLVVHQFLPAADGSRATCLYEADSVDRVRNFVDGALGDASTQYYVPVAEEQALGLPAKKLG
jgi:hypothetical protein